MKTKMLNCGALLLALLLMNMERAMGQAIPVPTIQWQKSFGGCYGVNALYDLQQTSDGGYILGGRSNCGISGNKTSTNYGYSDFWVVKIDASGNKIWEKSYGGLTEDSVTSLQQTSDGGYILGGYSQSVISGNKTSTNYGSYDYWVVKINTNGNKIWEKSFGGSSDDYLRSLQQTSDGGYILGGNSSSGISGSKTNINYGGVDCWVIKLDTNCNVMWQRSFGGSSDDYLNSLQQTSDGGYILGGYSESKISGNKTSTNYGDFDYWIIKADASGNKIWEKSFGGSGDDCLSSLQQTSDGGYILGGNSSSGISGSKTSTNYGYSDFWVVKIDASGNKIWEKSYGGPNNDCMRSLKQTSDGGYILGGYSESKISGNKTSTNYGYSDYWIIKVDANGNKVWDQSYGGSSRDDFYGIKQTSDGGYILGGCSYSVISGNKTSTNYGNVDFWVVKLDWVTPFANVPTPVQETYSCPITRQPGKDSLIIVTHGWIPKSDGETAPPNPDWIDDMANLVRSNLGSRGLNNWQVETFKWKEKAWFSTPISKLLDNAEKEGGSLGDCVGNQGWSHIHLIGHSAGAAVIQAATLNIKSKNIDTVVHTTFLDAYIGITYGGRSRYGVTADWADHYFTLDADTHDYLFFGRTASKLDHAYNIDISWLDPNKISLGRYRSTAGGGIEECFETATSHGWPHEFYSDTVPPVVVQIGSQGFGFPLSKEGGGWDFARANYSAYTDPIRVLGTSDEPCPLGNDYSAPVYPPWMMNFNQTPSVSSTTGLVENNGSFFTLSDVSAPQLHLSKEMLMSDTSNTSSAPTWLATVLSVTNKINLVFLDAEFTSTNGAEGILSVYWDTNSIGTVDERVVVPGLRHYVYSLPQIVTNGTHTLGFRLDSFSGAISSVTITNVALSFVGISDSFNLYLTGKDTNGFNLLKLKGPSGFNYIVETSSNLIDWSTMAILINTNGTVPFVDRTSNSTVRFYRVVGY